MSETNQYVIANKSDLVAVANAIREKTGGGSPLSLSEFVSAITGIETSGGADEILSLFGASKYKIGLLTVDSYYFIKFPIIDSLSSVDDIKLVVAIRSDYVEGVSLTIPEQSNNYTTLYIGFSLNGLQTETYIRSDDSCACCNGWSDFHIYTNYMMLNTPQSTIFDKNYYYLILYNETQEE